GELGAQDVARAALVAPAAGRRRTRAGRVGGVGEARQAALIGERRGAREAGVGGPCRRLPPDGTQGEGERGGPDAGGVALRGEPRPPWASPPVERDGRRVA